MRLMTALLKARPAKPPVSKSNGQQVVLHDIPWQAYVTMCDALPERYIRMTYDRGELEIMTVSDRHERYKTLLGVLIYVIAEVLDRTIGGFGSFTHRRRDLARALEPDQCYYLANFKKVRGKERIDLTKDPPPDLAVEVEISRSLLDRIGILAALGVPEIWRFEGTDLRVQILKNGNYVDSETSLAFPEIDIAKLAGFLHLGFEEGDLAMGRALRSWLRRRRARMARRTNKNAT
jgi:Uma2 family endonuclease